MNPFLERYAELIASQAAGQGTVAPPDLDAETARALLDLTRVVAHTQERRFGPLAAYLTGIAVERARAAGVSLDGAAVATLVDRVANLLEAETPPAS